jgi:flagellar hook-associated protein 2
VSTISISGGSIDVATLVSQLMAVERQPLTRLESRESEIQSRLSAYGRVQSALSTLDSAVAALARATTFSPAKAAVSGEGATATATGTAPTGTYSIAVSQLARAQSTVSAQVATATTAIGSGTLTLRDGGGAVLAALSIGATGDGTLAEIRDSINAAGVGVRASLVGDGGQVRLVLNSSATGAASAFTVEADGALTALGFSTVQTARDASYSVNGLALTSSSNVISDAIEGVTLSLAKAPPDGSPVGTTVDALITVGSDADEVVKSVQAFVTAYNEVDKLVASLTKYDPTTRTAALLNGESALRQVQSQLRGMLRGAVSGGTGDYARLYEVGITVQTDGSLKLDESRLRTAAAEPAKLARLFANDSALADEDGLALRMQSTVKSLLDANGVLDSRQSGLKATIRTLDQQQERMEARLAQIEIRLRQQYSALDALLTTRQSQSTALANALAGLPSNSST